MPAEDRAENEDVTVWLVASKEKGGILLRGRAKGYLKRSCDRCGCAYDDLSDGNFDVLLKAELGDVDESLYDDVQNVDSDEIEVSGHVRDALYLGMETRALCKKDCAGINFNQRNGEDPGNEDMDTEIDGRGTIAHRAAGNVLLQMKERLQQEGL
ncbi:Large ribosomal RNA subunit accumulation protein YceD [Gracilaria domingensis]|nr:Large ribosomal RNA subunit accumulation protein YceD [Gracilaria domingensis]